MDGFIEEMLDGQKVVKVFCHKEAAKEDFHRVNEALRESADMANRYANLLMPVNANIGWLSYALVAIVGAVLGINGMAGVTLGTVITFVGLNKNFYSAHYSGEHAGELRGQRRCRRAACL